jgi:hypothetical protein
MEQLSFCQGCEASKANVEALHHQSMLTGTVRKSCSRIQEQSRRSFQMNKLQIDFYGASLIIFFLLCLALELLQTSLQYY